MRHPLRALLLALTLAALTGCGVNNIPTYDEAVNAAWSQVLNQYQRRFDLVPNLVSTVKGAAAFEQETLNQVVEARSRVGQVTLPENILSNKEAFVEYQKSQEALGSAISRLLMVAENYPQLKATEGYLTLQSQLEGIENRIAVARRDYIGAVQRYNTELRTIPGRWWHSLLYSEMELRETFTVEAKVQQAPEVKF